MSVKTYASSGSPGFAGAVLKLPLADIIAKPEYFHPFHKFGFGKIEPGTSPTPFAPQTFPPNWVRSVVVTCYVPPAGSYGPGGPGTASGVPVYNVAAPLLYQGVGRTDRVRRARVALERLGLGDRVDHEPTELSGGQQQRVAVARALVTEPALILADEPTGNLDSHAGAEVISLLRELHRAGRTIVLITHDADVAASADRQVHLLDGRIAA